jgi:hypothetical protein
MLEILFRNFQLLMCCGLLHQLSVMEISDAFCHSVDHSIWKRKKDLKNKYESFPSLSSYLGILKALSVTYHQIQYTKLGNTQE